VSTPSHHWFAVASCDSIPVREGRVVELDGRQIAIFNLGEEFRAVENKCPHRGGPLADGILSGSKVVCPLHSWTFDLADGSVTNHPESQACLTTFPVRVEQGIISVQLPAQPDPDATPALCDHPDRPVRWVQRKALTSV
jgi:nitrite reductase (NADH) small subunit